MHWGPPLRIVTPVFNLINHCSRASANTRFVVKDKCTFDLIARARRRPYWRCLTSCGFIPLEEAKVEGKVRVRAGGGTGVRSFVGGSRREQRRKDWWEIVSEF